MKRVLTAIVLIIGLVVVGVCPVTQAEEATLTDEQLALMVSFYAHLSARQAGYTVVPDDILDPDTGEWIPASVSAWAERIMDDYRPMVDSLQKSIADTQKALEDASNERSHNSLQHILENQMAELEVWQGRIDKIQADLDAGLFISHTEAIRMWSEQTGLSADRACESALRALWAESFVPLFEADTETLAAMGFPGFWSGSQVISHVEGLWLSLMDARMLEDMDSILR